TEHFFPYVGDLIHYDAVSRGRSNRVAIERNNFRGGGALAHRILRQDPDLARLDGTRRGFEALVPASESALGRVAAALARFDEATDESGFVDETEADVIVYESP